MLAKQDSLCVKHFNEHKHAPEVDKSETMIVR